MNIFVIHSTKDLVSVETILNQIIESTKTPVLFTVLKNSPLDWKNEAAAEIRYSDFVLYIVGQTSHRSEFIGWELKQSFKIRKKIIAIKINQDNIIYNAHKQDNLDENSITYSNQTWIDEMKIEKVVDYIDYIYSEKKSLGLENNIEVDNDLVYKQYEIYLKTSEDLVARRQNVNNIYVTLNSIMITLFGAIIVLAFEHSMIQLGGLIGLGIAVVGFVICYSWKSLLESYGRLNASKMEIITEIEKKLCFNLYSTEWRILSRKIGKAKYHSFTKIEKRSAVIFSLLYVLAAIYSLINTLA